ncbi:MAG TPA: sulfate adenylyltransferase subunit CysN [Bryobacteraceae bacterium]|jgi:sulfate adenylyltransferase large subunit|nr:sulfate adenylyltransferase subunit CysN [Bryobacteraceae bacterium]
MAVFATAVEDKSFESFLERERAKDLLRFTTAGSVDDGKSTLIGRLLYDSRSVYDDQLESVTKASVGRNAGAIDFSLLTDGLRAEREQGITIDVAYRYFATPRRKFIIADTPGHEQYTRNMVTGASTAELAIVLVDARKGLLPQSRRHAYIASLLGLPQVVIAVNKMDLVDYSEAVFSRIEEDFRQFLSHLNPVEAHFIPISALEGDNVVKRSARMSWFWGPSLLEVLETVPVGTREEQAAFRFPVQRVVRPNHAFRGYAGRIAAGVVRTGDRVTVFPSGRSSNVSAIVTFDGDLESAQAGQSVTLTLADELDISRGDVLVSGERAPEVSSSFDATIVWLNEKPSEPHCRYRLKHASRIELAELASIHHRININTLEHEPATALEMNAIGSVRVETARSIAFDPYVRNRATGSFILIDAVTNATVAAGMITGTVAPHHLRAKEHGPDPVTPVERIARRGHTGAAVRLGGRTEVAWRLERALFDRGCFVVTLEESQVSYALLEAGLLVLVVGEDAQGFAIDSADGKTGSGELPLDDLEAVHAVERLLEQLRILLPTTSWDYAGGI